MEFVTEPWQPVPMLKIQPDYSAGRPVMGSSPSLGDYEARHWLALIGAAIFVIAPLAWLLTGNWAWACFLISVSLLMVSTAAMLVPEVRVDLDGYESDED